MGPVWVGSPSCSTSSAGEVGAGSGERGEGQGHTPACSGGGFCAQRMGRWLLEGKWMFSVRAEKRKLWEASSVQGHIFGPGRI